MKLLCSMVLFLALSGCTGDKPTPDEKLRSFNVEIENVAVLGIAKDGDSAVTEKSKAETAILLSAP